jgi:NADH-quinone oxidoreductase subunit J
MQHQHAQHEDGSQKSMQHGHRSMDDMKMDGMSMDDMNMFTPIKKQAAVLAYVVAALLIALILLRPSWPVVSQIPDQNSPAQVGALLMGKYMIAFEGCGLLILLGIFASVMISRPATHSDASDREHLRAAVEEAPALVEPDTIVPTSPASESEGENG